MSSDVSTLDALALRWQESRSPADLAALRDAVRHVPGFRTDLDVAGETAGAHARGAHAEVLVTVEAAMPGAFLSPAAHAALATAYDALGDTSAAEHQRGLARLALDSIAATGDGSAARPWRPLRLSDQYDLLRWRGRRSRRVDLVVRGGRRLDRHRCTDGSVAWFDIGAAAPAPTDRT
ncbi:DUF4919 domain-containing protein [Nocardioides sp. SLBN-35]|uniref:DUF4919 domain-containing protein n=1 Tax=Nocardioides sp. SLBN-35 TaxID=2768445 RepID=UPI00116F9E4E|nr:DUF4919 domain-containing protein [Nocardioides sp. SLBN-35]TQK72487.1 hypothetical protein FBY23_4300 [Nocardioides sp. SLBN-35]